jgi:SAM-dependent methyltransferase
MTELRIHIDGGDLLQQDAIRSTVREIYGTVGPTDRRVAERYYSPDDLAWLPDATVRSALGVGNPVAFADLRPGETVVDLGSGGGIDCLLAGRAVGPSGSVIGVDFLEDAVARALRAAADAGLDNVRFAKGEIEDLPLADESVDVVISNGVPNLSPRKGRVMAEAYRVLRPGGRLAIIDLLMEGHLPAEIQTHPAAWAGCLSGALSERAMYTAVRRAGFRAVSIQPLEPFGIEECALYPLFTPALLELIRRLVPAGRQGRIATSTLIRARKPVPGEMLPGRAPLDRGATVTSGRS